LLSQKHFSTSVVVTLWQVAEQLVYRYGALNLVKVGWNPEIQDLCSNTYLQSYG